MNKPNGNIKVYKKEVARINSLNSQKQIKRQALDKEDAEQLITDFLSELEKKELDDEALTQAKKEIKKDKSYLREIKRKKREQIIECITQKGIEVRGYNNDNIELFINEMVAETAGYSILEDAFNDPGVSDIYCIKWNVIFVEKNGENIPYWKTFKSPKHYNIIIDRLMMEAGKELNVGDSKIVNFELYGDRGCATSEAVSPDAKSVTIRKHKEDHVVFDEIIDQEVMSEEMREFFEMIIDGEMNLIYGGLTGSGKTTTIRAMIDSVVTRNKKRMLVCEDTQELFPKNKHTLQLVSSPTKDPDTSIDLIDLIYAALRLKPKYVVVGEVRGMEAVAAVEAMETGHSTIFTMHGGKAANIINRLNSKYLMGMPSIGSAVADRIIGAAVDFIAIQSSIPSVGRVCSSIVEVSYDFDNEKIVLKTIFKYDYIKREHVLVNRLSEEKIDKLIERDISLELAQRWKASDDPEEEAAYIKEFNDKYRRERPARQAFYAKRKKEREEQRILFYKEKLGQEAANLNTLESLKEVEKQKEFEDIQQNFIKQIQQ